MSVSTSTIGPTGPLPSRSKIESRREADGGTGTGTFDERDA